MGLLGIIVKALSDSLLTSLFNFIQAEMHDRQLIAQGRQDQHVDDLEQGMAQAKQAAASDEKVVSLSDRQLDATLNLVRRGIPGRST
jgi:hypothetical protein